MKIKLTESMSQKLITITQEAPISEAYALMQEKRIRHLPVVNEANEIVGIVSQRNLIHLDVLIPVPVKFLMSQPVDYVHQDVPLKNAVLRMLERKISSLLVTNDIDEAVGIVTTDDLLWQFSRLLEEHNKERWGLPNAVQAQTIGEIAYKLALAGM